MQKISEITLEMQLYARTPQHQRAVARMQRMLSEHLDARSYVGFSGGKDSAVIAHACQALRPGIPMLCADAGVPTMWEEQERQRWVDHAAAAGWNLHLFPFDKWGHGATAGAKDEAAHRRAVHGMMFAGVDAYAAEHGLDQVVMGLRAEESDGRAASLATHGPAYTYKDGRRRLCPIDLWSWRDVWAYHLTHGLPWLRIYDALGPQARSGLIGRNGVAHGRMAYLRRHFPAAWRYARDVLGLTYAKDC